mmetsp:Transcript_37501/g.83872  ORF Transcript_37501/g.83872 Transcript_37501/m.83872 type:complete len:240 (+) Transcript_37501:1216-1935(+)
MARPSSRGGASRRPCPAPRPRRRACWPRWTWSRPAPGRAVPRRRPLRHFTPRRRPTGSPRTTATSKTGCRRAGGGRSFWTLKTGRRLFSPTSSPARRRLQPDARPPLPRSGKLRPACSRAPKRGGPEERPRATRRPGRLGRRRGRRRRRPRRGAREASRPCSRLARALAAKPRARAPRRMSSWRSPSPGAPRSGWRPPCPPPRPSPSQRPPGRRAWPARPCGRPSRRPRRRPRPRRPST